MRKVDAPEQQTKALVLNRLRVNPYNELSLTSKGRTMSHLLELIKALVPQLKCQQDLDEAYLCASADVVDLERRMRLVDVAARDNARSLMFGTMMP
jgi:hypothetical protein